MLLDVYHADKAMSTSNILRTNWAAAAWSAFAQVTGHWYGAKDGQVRCILVDARRRLFEHVSREDPRHGGRCLYRATEADSKAEEAKLCFGDRRRSRRRRLLAVHLFASVLQTDLRRV